MFHFLKSDMKTHSALVWYTISGICKKGKQKYDKQLKRRQKDNGGVVHNQWED